DSTCRRLDQPAILTSTLGAGSDKWPERVYMPHPQSSGMLWCNPNGHRYRARRRSLGLAKACKMLCVLNSKILGFRDKLAQPFLFRWCNCALRVLIEQFIHPLLLGGW